MLGRGPRGLCWAEGHGRVTGGFGAEAALISQGGEGGFIGRVRRRWCLDQVSSALCCDQRDGTARGLLVLAKTVAVVPKMGSGNSKD